MASEASRERILEAALAEFAQRGFDATTTAAVARLSGVTQPLVHYYFGTKEGLWRAAMELLSSRLSRVLDAASDDAATLGPDDAIRVILRRFVYYCASNPQLSQIVAREAGHKSGRFEWLLEKYLITLVRQIEQQFVRAAEGRPLESSRIEHLVFAFLGAATFVFTSSALAEGVYGSDPFESEYVEQFAATLSELFLHGLRPATA